MARSGRRYRIGAAGPLSTDETLGGGDSGGSPFTRGEVRPYTPQVPQDIPSVSTPTGGGETAPAFVIIGAVPESGGDAPGQGGGPGPGSGPSGDPGAGPDAGVEARGGKIGGAQSEHPITAQNGEWVIQESAVKKYGDKFMAALNAGQIPVQSHEQYAKGGKVKKPDKPEYKGDAPDAYASGGKVGSGRRFAALEHKLAGRPGVTNPAGLAAAIGRKKFGKARFQSMAASGR